MRSNAPKTLCEFKSNEIPKIQKSLVFKNDPLIFLFYSVLFNTLPFQLNYQSCSKYLRLTSPRYKNIRFSNITYLQLKRSLFFFSLDNTPRTENGNRTYIWRWKGVLDIFWAPHIHSVCILCQWSIVMFSCPLFSRFPTQ